MPKPMTSGLQTFLASIGTATAMRMAELYVFTLTTGETFYYSAFQTPVTAPLPATTSPTYNFVLGPRFKRGNIRCQIGPQVDELNVEIFAGPHDLLAMNSGGTITWQNAFHQGIFDGAYCQLLWAYISYTAPNYLVPTVQGTITMFHGRIGDIEIGRTSSKLIVKSMMDLLTVQMPRRLFQSACNHVFGQAGTGMCGYDRVNGLNGDGVSVGIGNVPITALAGSDQLHIVTSFAPSPSTAYDNGTIQGTSGLNNGFNRTIGKITGGVIYFLKPFIFPVVAGTDTFGLLPGCDHTLTTCTNTFNNAKRYGGFPYIPPPESAV